jgi:hypothetical protein
MHPALLTACGTPERPCSMRHHLQSFLPAAVAVFIVHSVIHVRMSSSSSLHWVRSLSLYVRVSRCSGPRYVTTHP